MTRILIADDHAVVRAGLRQFLEGAHSRLSERESTISVKTVSTYRSRILEKMELRTNADLTAYALRTGLINHTATL